MEFKRSNSSLGPLNSARRRTASSSGDSSGTPACKATPKRSNSARGGGSDSPAPRTGLSPLPMPPRTPGKTGSARGPTSARGKKFERSVSATGSRSGLQSADGASTTFQRSNTAIGLQKAEKAKHNNRVNVYARVRAFALTETAGEQAELAVRMRDETVEVNVPKKGKFTFSFDGCFWSNDRECSTGKPYTSQADVFEEVGRPLVENALAGYNAAVMAYGQTGSGKTYTSFGPVGSLGSAEEGLIPRVCNMIFARAATSAAKGVRYTVSASMLEVYLEDVFDLLNHRKELSVRNDFKNNSFHVVGAKLVAVRSYKDVLAVLNKAEPLRTFAATNIHDHSSRAHTLFMLEVQTHFDSADLAPRCAKIMLADLAGCERIRLAGTEEGLAFEQARNINLSLLALGSCIEAVATRGKNETRPIPEFRNSTLTKLLKDYLGGNSISTMLVTISPSIKDSNLSVQTLRFADRAKQITTHAKVNTIEVAKRKEDGHDICDRLRDEYLRKKEALHSEYKLQTLIEQLVTRIESMEDQIRQCGEGDLADHLIMEVEEQQKKLEDADYQLGLARQVLYGEFLMLEDELRELNAKMQEMRAEHEEAIEGLLGEETGRFEEMKRSYEQRMDVLSRTLADREDDMGERNDEVARLKRLVAELEERLRAKDAECEDLLARLAELQERHDEDSVAAAAHAADLEEQLEAVRGLLAQSEEEGAAQRKAATQQRDSMNAVIEGLRGDVARLEDDVRAKESCLQATSEDLGQQLETTAATLAAVQESYDENKVELDAAIAELRADVAEKESAIATLETQLETTEQQLESKGGEADNLSEELVDTKEKLASTEESLQDTSAKLEETEEKLSSTEEALQDTSAKLEETEEKLASTEESLQDTSAKLEETEEKLASTEESLQDTSAKLEETEEKLASTEEALQDTSAKLEETEEKLASTEESLQHTSAKLEETEEKLSSTEEALREKGGEADNLSEELADTKEKLASTEESLQDTSAKLEETEEKLASTEEALQDTSAKLEETEGRLQETEEALLEKGGEADNLSEELADTKEKLASTEEALQDTSVNLEETEGRLQRTEEALQDVMSKLEEAESRLGQQEDEIHDKEGHAETVERELYDCKETLDNVQSRLETVEAELAESNEKADGLERQLSSTDADLMDKSERLDLTENRLAAVESDLSDSKQQLEDTECRLAQTERELQEKENEVQSLSQELYDASEKLDDTETRLQQTDQELAENKEALEDAEKKLTNLEDNASDLAAKLEETEGRLQETEEALREKGGEADNLSEELADTKEKLASTEEALQDTSAKLEETEEKLSSTEEALQDTSAKLEETEEKLASTEEALQDTSAKLEETEEKLASTEEALQDTSAKLEETEQRLGADISSLEDCLGFSRKECAARDVYMADLLEYVRVSYETTLTGFATVQEKALEGLMATSEFGLKDLSGSVEREAARFDMLRRVLGKIGDEVKTASTEVTVQERRQRSPSPRASQMRDITQRANAAPAVKSRSRSAIVNES